jgi:hypothetical protein
MGRIISAEGAWAGAQLIERAYREGDEFQFLRELTQNGIEAGATKIQFGLHWTGVNRGNDDWSTVPGGKRLHKNRYRLVYYDNGCGMGSAMGDYMSGLLDLDSKERTGSAHDNFNMGVRVALLPWNRAGVVIASWSDETPDGQIMWIHHVPDIKGGYYEAATLEWEEANGSVRYDEVAPADAFEEFIDDRPAWLGPKADGSIGTGTMFLLLGNTGQEHTFLGPEGTWNNYSGQLALARRYWEHPANLDLRYEDPGTTNTDEWYTRARERCGRTTLDGSTPTKDVRVYNSPVHSQKLSVDKPYDTATIPLPDGGRMTVFLSRSKAKHFTGSNQSAKPSIAVRYRNELYHRRATPADYRRFGVSYPDVYNRLWIIVEPRTLGAEGPADDELRDPLGGVYPTGSRTSLQYLPALEANGTRGPGRDLPWSTWETLFNEHMPDFVDKALFDAMGDSDDTDIDPDIVEQVAAPFVDRWKDIVWIPKDGGTVKGTTDGTSGGNGGGGGGRPGAGRRRRRPKGHADGYGSESGEMGPVPAALPECRMDAAPFADLVELVPRTGVIWTPDAKGPGTVTIDPTHPVIAEVFEHWQALYSPHDRRKVNAAVKAVYEVAMACRVGQILRYGQTQKMTPHQLDESLLNERSLTASLFGLVSEDVAIKQRVSGLRRLKK